MIYVPLGALIAALVPLYFTWISFRHQEDQSEEDRMADRINQLEQTLNAAQGISDALRRENYDLQRRIIELEKNSKE